MGPTEDSARRVRQAITGDGDALKVLLAGLHTRLCDHLSRKLPVDLRGSLDGEDLAQEAYLEVFRHIASFRPRGPESFDRWVFAIALSRLRNAVKRRRADKRGGRRVTIATMRRRNEDSMIALLDQIAAPDRTPSRSVARIEAVQAMETALAGLSEHYRQAIWLVHIEGRSIAAVATKMGRTERAIHALCRRGLKALRAELGSASSFLTVTD